MKRFGSFKPLDAVVSQDRLTNLHVAVSSVTELTETYPNNTIAVFTKSDGEYKSGDVVVKKNGTWIKLQIYLPKIGPVTNLRGYRLDKKVYLKYKSPQDLYDNNGKKICSWMKEIVVRKYGSSPATEYDGTVVREILRKNVFDTSASQYLVDYVPDADKESDWYYRVFTVADNGNIDYEHTAEAIKVYDMPWSNIVEAIRNGHATKVFSVGDAFSLGDGNRLIIANITNRSPYRVTMVLEYATFSLPFDSTKLSGYRITRDTRIQARKTYYEDKLDGSIGPVSMYSGSPITKKLYELVAAGISSKGDAERKEHGCNRWSISDIRYWLNLTNWASVSEADKEFMRVTGCTLTESQFEDPSTIPDGTPIPPYLYLKKYQPDILDCIVTTTCRTAMPPVDGINYEETSDKFFLPSFTELTGLKNNDKIAEGTIFDAYDQGLATRDAKKLNPDGSFTSGHAFTRSPYINDKDTGYNVLPTSGGEANLLEAKDAHYILAAFNIG